MVDIFFLFMTSRRPLPRRIDRARVARRLARGLSVPSVAQAEGVAPPRVEALLDDRNFQALLGHYRRLAGLSRDERRERLVDLAMDVLEHALQGGDLGAARFVLGARAAGLCPAAALTDATIDACERADADTQPPPRLASRSPRAPSATRDAIAPHLMARTRPATFRARLLAEEALVDERLPVAAEVERPAPATPSPATAPATVLPAILRKRLLSGTAAPDADDPLAGFRLGP
jgi:hypothetical protein